LDSTGDPRTEVRTEFRQNISGATMESAGIERLQITKLQIKNYQLPYV